MHFYLPPSCRLLCFTGPWITHTSFLNSPLYNAFSPLSQRLSLREWTDETMVALFFPFSETPALSSLAPLPFPRPPFVPSTLLDPIEGTLFISFQSNQSLWESASRPDQLSWSGRQLRPIYCCVGRATQQNPRPPSSPPRFIVTLAVLRVGNQRYVL